MCRNVSPISSTLPFLNSSGLWILPRFASARHCSRVVLPPQGRADRPVVSQVRAGKGETGLAVRSDQSAAEDARFSRSFFSAGPNNGRRLQRCCAYVSSMQVLVVTLRLLAPFPARSADSIISLVILVLENAQLSVERSDFQACLENWYRLRDSMDWSPEWARRALAAAEATSLCLQDFSSTLVRCVEWQSWMLDARRVWEQGCFLAWNSARARWLVSFGSFPCGTKSASFSPPPHVLHPVRSLVQPHAESFEKACDIDPKYIINFSEETIRGHSVFILGCVCGV